MIRLCLKLPETIPLDMLGWSEAIQILASANQIPEVHTDSSWVKFNYFISH